VAVGSVERGGVGHASSRPSYWQQVAAGCAGDFLQYLVFVMGVMPAEHHLVICERLLYGTPMELILGPPDSGKCVAGSDTIPLADGRRKLAAELVGTDFSLLTVTEAGIEPVRAHAEWNRLEPVYEVMTDSGRRIRRNAQHPLWCADTQRDGLRVRRTWQAVGKHGSGRMLLKREGWWAVADIRPGDLVAVAAELPYRPWCSTLTDAEVAFLAYMIAEGTVGSGTLRLTQKPGAVLDDMREVARSVGCDLRPVSAIDYTVAGIGNRQGQAKRRNPGKELLRAHGVLGRHSREKRVPDAVWGLPDRQVALFLNRLYACDGSALVNWKVRCPVGLVTFTSASRGLVEDVQELLLRFGVSSRIRHREAQNAWTVDIQRAADLLAFATKIGALGKEARIDEVRRFASTRRNLQRWRRAGLPDGLQWERVRSVTYTGDERTVAIEVPGHQTFLSTFWEHNTTIMVGYITWTLGRNPNYRWLVASEGAVGIATVTVTQVAETIAANERYQMVFGALRDPRGRGEWSSQSIRLRTYLSTREAARLHQPPSPPAPPWLQLPERSKPPMATMISPRRGRDAALAHPNVKAVGWRSGYTGVRCEGIVCDDLVSDRSSRSEAMTDAIHSTLHQKLLARLTGQQQRVVVLGQRWAPRDLYGRLLESSTVSFNSNPNNEGLEVLEGVEEEPGLD